MVLILKLEYHIWFGNVVELEFIADVMCGFASFDIYFLFFCKSTRNMECYNISRNINHELLTSRNFTNHTEKRQCSVNLIQVVDRSFERHL